MDRRLAFGSLSGIIATLPMTFVMEKLFRELPARDRYPLPPREITDVLLEKSHLDRALIEKHQIQITVALHFLYGAFAGGVFGMLQSSGKPPRAKSNILEGALFGSAIWALSYLEILPALKILKPATQHPFRRNSLMVAAHWVWGGTLAVSYRSFTTIFDSSHWA